MANTSSKNPLARDVLNLLRELLHGLLTASVPAWLNIQLTLPQLRTIFIIAHNKTCSVMQIAKGLGVGEPTASHLVDKLLQAGLAERNIDPADRRRAIVRLTPAGKALIEKILGWENLLGDSLYKVSEKDLTLLRDGLKAVVREVSRRTAKSV